MTNTRDLFGTRAPGKEKKKSSSFCYKLKMVSKSMAFVIASNKTLFIAKLYLLT